MKNYFVLNCAIMLMLLLGSCSKTIQEDNDIQAKQKTTPASPYYTLSVENSFTPICAASPSGIDVTYDVAIYFSTPLLYDARLAFKLQSCKKNAGGYYGFSPSLISPWTYIDVNAGTTKVVLDASCVLPGYVECSDSDRGVKTTHFKITLTSAQYVNSATFDYVPLNGNNFIYTKGSAQCIGGWNQ